MIVFLLVVIAATLYLILGTLRGASPKRPVTSTANAAMAFGASEKTAEDWRRRTWPTPEPISPRDWALKTEPERLALVQRTVLTVYGFLEGRPLMRTMDQYIEAVDRLLRGNTVALLSVPQAVYDVVTSDYPHDDLVTQAVGLAAQKLAADRDVPISRGDPNFTPEDHCV